MLRGAQKRQRRIFQGEKNHRSRPQAPCHARAGLLFRALHLELFSDLGRAGILRRLTFKKVTPVRRTQGGIFFCLLYSVVEGSSFFLPLILTSCAEFPVCSLLLFREYLYYERPRVKWFIGIALLRGFSLPEFFSCRYLLINRCYLRGNFCLLLWSLFLLNFLKTPKMFQIIKKCCALTFCTFIIA